MLIILENIPDALKSECSKCTEKQINLIKEVTKFLKERKPDVWQKLLQKYDPEGTYTKRYEELEKQGKVPK